MSCAADLSGVMGSLIFLMSSDAVGEINFASFRPGFISSRLEIHWKNKRHDKRERKKKAGEWEKKREGEEGRGGATGDDRTNHGRCPAANQSTVLLLVSHIVHFYVYISFKLICRRARAHRIRPDDIRRERSRIGGANPVSSSPIFLTREYVLFNH